MKNRGSAEEAAVIIGKLLNDTNVWIEWKSNCGLRKFRNGNQWKREDLDY